MTINIKKPLCNLKSSILAEKYIHIIVAPYLHNDPQTI